jgi:hypothetical protein
MRQGTYIALAVVALAAAACGGGGGGGSAPGTSALPGTTTTTAPIAAVTTPAVQSTLPPAPAGYARASFSITVPKASGSSANGRRPAVVSSSTQSITFTLMQQNGASVTGSTPQTFGLTATNSYCTTTAAGLTCSLQINAPIGADLYLAQTYSGTSGNGSLTGSGAVALSVQQNSSNSANLSLTGQVSSIYLAASSTYLGNYSYYPPASSARRPANAGPIGPNNGYVSTAQIFVIALDQTGTMILNPSVYSTPITLQLVYPIGGAPDTTLQVVPGSEGGATTSTSSNYGTVVVNSPSDVITATLISNVAGAAPYVGIVGSIGGALLSAPPSALPSAPPTPVPTALPSGTQFLQFSVNLATGITVTDPNNGNLPLTAINDVNLKSNTNPYYPGPYPYSVTEGRLSGSFTETDNCAAVTTVTLTNQYPGYATLSRADIAAGTCTVTISDGQGNTFTLPITVTTTTVVGQ